MKKFLFAIVVLMTLGVSQVSAQMPSCSNDNMIQNKVGSYVNRGYSVLSTEFYQIAYLVAPTPPFLLGTYEVILVGPYCGPACTPVMETLRWDATVTNYNGNCHWAQSNW